jgi:hypothetical protein
MPPVRAAAGVGTSDAAVTVEISSGIITRQAIRRVATAASETSSQPSAGSSTRWNERSHPFVWTKPGDDLLDHCRPGQQTSFPRAITRSLIAHDH